MQILTLPDGIRNERCDKVLSRQLNLPRSVVKFSFKRTPFICNGKAIHLHEKVNSGDRIFFEICDSLPPPLTSNDPCVLHIIFEDEDIIVINKPAGVVVHSAPGIQGKTLVEYVLGHCPLSRLGDPERPGIVHRLDRETTGLIVFAKSNRAFKRLTADFADHLIEKRYTCIIQGTPSLNTGKIEIPIARQNSDKIRMIACPSGKSAKTTWTIRECLDHFTWLDVRIHTGRTHQIRVHMSHIGHPIGGDKTYGYDGNFIFPRIMLHAESLGFIHPKTGEKISFFAPIPEDFSDILEKLQDDRK
ncbi:MAG: RluA family pseudouridine synthase [Puniceicoccales bacterium]|jgi:23S rRNA pseudouridine1911/1915/1917 synthase|nr:RluA family pseudouridine synthase [Puniceicoccales bacterium]